MPTPIATLKPEKKSSVKVIVIYAAALIGVGLLVYFGGGIAKNIGNLGGKSSLSASVLYGEAEVLLNGEYLGVTPFESKEIKSGENKVTIKNNVNQYETALTFLKDAQVVINRDIGVSDTFSSGQDFWIEKGKSDTVLGIISNPDGAQVFIDGTEVGKTPFSSNNLSEGEYDLRIEMPGYESQTARIKIQKGYKLNVAVKLFPMPLTSTVELLEGSEDLYGLFSDQSAVYSDPQKWAKGIVYWNQTRGINLAGLGVNKDLVFDFFLDYRGNLYTKDGTLITDASGYDLIKGATKGGYLGKASDGKVLTQEASDAYQNLSSSGTVLGSIKTATILETGTGWLRVRDSANLEGNEIAKVNVGEKFTVLEEQTGWVKIKVNDTTEGWVSADYVELSE